MTSTTFWIQFLGVIFGLGMMYFTFVKFKRKEISRFELSVWFTGWILMVVIAIVPFALDPIITPLHFYRRLDFFVVLGFFILLGLGFFNYSTMKRMERRMEIFVRKEALQKDGVGKEALMGDEIETDMKEQEEEKEETKEEIILEDKEDKEDKEEKPVEEKKEEQRLEKN